MDGEDSQGWGLTAAIEAQQKKAGTGKMGWAMQYCRQRKGELSPVQFKLWKLCLQV